jgi:hypothetical protein
MRICPLQSTLKLPLDLPVGALSLNIPDDQRRDHKKNKHHSEDPTSGDCKHTEIADDSALGKRNIDRYCLAEKQCDEPDVCGNV